MRKRIKARVKDFKSKTIEGAVAEEIWNKGLPLACFSVTDTLFIDYHIRTILYKGIVYFVVFRKSKHQKGEVMDCRVLRNEYTHAKWW